MSQPSEVAIDEPAAEPSPETIAFPIGPSKAQAKKFKEFVALHNAKAEDLQFLSLTKRRLAEGTRSPLFILEEKVFELVPHEIAEAFRARADGHFDQLADDCGNVFESAKFWSRSEMRTRFPKAFHDAWQVADVGGWLTREEAEEYSAKHADRFPNGIRARPIAANGLLEELLKVL